MALFFVAQMLGAAITLIVTLALTRILGPADFGIYNIIIMSGAIGFAVLFGWMAAAINRFHFVPEFKDRTIAVVLGVALVLLIVGAPILIVTALQLPPAWVVPTVLVAVYCVSHATHEIMMTCFRVYRAAKPFAVAVIGRPILGLVFALALAWAGFGAEGAILGMSAGALIMGGYAITRVYRRSGVRRPDAAAVRTFFVFGLPLSILGAASTTVALITQTALVSLASLEAVGIFAATQILAMRTITMPMMILNRVSSPNIYEAFEERGGPAAQEELNRHFSFLLMMSGPILLAYFAANNTIAAILFEDDFSEGVARNLPFLTLAAFVTGIQASFFSFSFTISQRSWIQLAIIMTMTALHFGVAFGAIWLFGPIGAAFGSLITASLGLLAFSTIGQRIYAIALPLRDLAKFAVSLAAGAPFALYADHVDGAANAMGWVVLSMAVFALGLLLLRQEAMIVVIRYLWDRVVGRRALEGAE